MRVIVRLLRSAEALIGGHLVWRDHRRAAKKRARAIEYTCGRPNRVPHYRELIQLTRALLIVFHSPILFGYAKPVPVNFRRLRNPRRDMIWVAAAGPAMNLAMATATALLIHAVGLLPRPYGNLSSWD